MLKFNMFVIFSGFILTSAIFVVWSKNPIFSVLFLIFSFFNVSAVLFLFDFEFLPIVFLVVYVGAVAVLFLFVLIMLNIKLAELVDNHFYILPVALLLASVIIYQLVFLLRFEFDFLEHLNNSSVPFLNEFVNTTTLKMDFFDLSFTLSNIRLLGLAFFSDYLYHFMLAGMVLLLAMVSAILLTLHKNFVNKTQNIYSQILKDYTVAIKFVT